MSQIGPVSKSNSAPAQQAAKENDYDEYNLFQNSTSSKAVNFAEPLHAPIPALKKQQT